MKETKYRAWDKVENCWVEICELVFENGFAHRVRTNNDAMHFRFGNENVILMQWTGLKDKRGKFIYEGDIIRYTNEGADDTPYAVPRMVPENWEDLMAIGDSEWEIDRNQYSNIEVVGDIYNNPKMLK